MHVIACLLTLLSIVHLLNSVFNVRVENAIQILTINGSFQYPNKYQTKAPEKSTQKKKKEKSTSTFTSFNRWLFVFIFFFFNCWSRNLNEKFVCIIFHWVFLASYVILCIGWYQRKMWMKRNKIKARDTHEKKEGKKNEINFCDAF